MSGSPNRRLAQAAAGLLDDENQSAIEQRIQAYITEMGGGTQALAVGNQLDALLKWFEAIQAGKVAFDALDLDPALKTALTPLFNLPPELVGIIAIWKGIKDRLPKEE